MMFDNRYSNHNFKSFDASSSEVVVCGSKPAVQPMPLLEFQTAKELLIQNLKKSKINEISTSNLKIKLTQNGTFRFIKKRGIMA